MDFGGYDSVRDNVVNATYREYVFSMYYRYIITLSIENYIS